MEENLNKIIQYILQECGGEVSIDVVDGLIVILWSNEDYWMDYWVSMLELESVVDPLFIADNFIDRIRSTTK